MTAPNHALTGAFIGLSIANPWLALPLAFLSHFVCDAIPHYDLAEENDALRIRSRRFLYEFVLLGAGVCILLVAVLVLTRPQHWLQAAIAAFLAVSTDLLWIPRFLTARRTGEFTPSGNWFRRFHSAVQWKTGPKLIWLELAWFVCFGGLVLARL